MKSMLTREGDFTMITADKARKDGIDPDEELTPLDVLGDNAMTSQEVADALNAKATEGSINISYSCAKQRLVRLEAKGLVERKKFKGLIHWLKVAE